LRSIPLPIRARIALFCSIVVCFTVLAFSVGLYLLLNNSSYDQIDSGLSKRGQQLATSVARSGLPDPAAPSAPVDASESPVSFIGLADGGGRVEWLRLYGYGKGIDSVPAWALRAADAHGPSLVTVSPRQGESVRLYVQPVPATGGWSYVVAGQRLQPTRENLNGLLFFIFLVAVITLLAALAATWIVLGPALRPLRQMAAEVERIGGTADLSRRLPESPVADEVSRLSGAFNRMLARLEAALDSQQRFVADASHELRTPLTSISANAALLLRHELDPAERRATLVDIEAESARMTRLVQGLLTLARADAGLQLERETVQLHEVVGDVARKASRLHPEVRVRAGLEPVQASVNGDALAQLAWILVDNATRHARSQVDVSLALANGSVRLAVADDGAGVPAEHLERIFERFHQADASRAAGGAGLGLAIARWIAEQHGGRLSVRNRDEGGACFELVLPG
jgi:signal transduction histidine kinase